MRRLAILAATLTLGVGGAHGDDVEQTLFPFMVKDTSTAKFAVEESARLLQQGRPERAIDIAQDLVDRMPDDFYRVTPTPESTLWRLASDVARDLLAGLDGPARAAYEQRVRPAAAPALVRALEGREPSRLSDLLVRYGASAEGRTAGRVLARIHLDAGRARDAAAAARESLRYAPRDPDLWLLLVDALAAAGDGVALEGLSPPAGLVGRRGGAQVDLAAHLASARRLHPAVRTPVGWPMWGGVPARDGVHAERPPFPTPLRWRRPTFLVRRSQDDEQRYIRGEEAYARFDALWESFRPLHPVVADRTVYVADGLAVHALDLYAGRVLWTFDASSPSPLALLRPTFLHGRTSLDRGFSAVVTDDLVIATVEVERNYSPDTLQGVEISSYQPRRALVGLERADGRLRWAMGLGMDRLVLADTTIVSPPALDGGLVLALGAVHEGQHNLAVYAFEAATGRLVWHRFLGAGQQELNLFGAPVKELAAGAPAIADGIAYAWTGLGFAAAVETRTGRPVWLASYQAMPLDPVQFWFRAPLRFPRVAAAPPVVHGDAVVMAPPDAEWVYAFDRRTGRVLWRHRHETADDAQAVATFLGVVNDGKRDVALLAGRDLLALDVKDGRVAWRGRFGEAGVGEARAFAVGQGTVAAGQVLVPTSAGIERFSLVREGKLEGSDPWPTDSAPGNLLPVGQVLVVSSRDALQGFYSWEEIQRDVQRRRRERPDDPALLIEAGEVYRLGGELGPAREMFQEALRLAKDPASPPGRRARLGVHMTWVAQGDALREVARDRALAAYRSALTWADEVERRVETRVRIDGLLRGDFAARVQNLQDLIAEAGTSRVAFDPEDGPVPARAAALLLLAQAQLGAGKPGPAVDALQRLLAEEGDAPFPEGPARRRARARIDEIVRAFGRDAYASHEEKARALLGRAVAAEDAGGLDRLLREYPNAAVVPDALLALGRRRLEGDPGSAATTLLRLLAEYPADARAAEAVALLARAYARSGAPGAQRFALARLATRLASARFELDGTSTTGAAHAEAERARLPRPAPETQMRSPLHRSAHEPATEDDLPRPVVVRTDPDEPSPVALMWTGSQLVGFDLVRGLVAFKLASGVPPQAAYARGVLVLPTPRALTGISPEDGRPRWEMALDGYVSWVDASRGQVFAFVRETSQSARTRRLLAIEPTSGRVLWSQELGAGEAHPLAIADGDVVVEESRFDDEAMRPVLVLYDGVTGAPRLEVPFPGPRLDRDVVVAGSSLALLARSGDGQRAITVHDVATGVQRWRKAMPPGAPPSAVLADGDALVVLLYDGRLWTLDLATGEARAQTRIVPGDGSPPFPYPGTPVLLDGPRLLLVPAIASREEGMRAAAFDRKTGALVWQTRFPAHTHNVRVTMLRCGPTTCAALVHADGGGGMTIRLLEAGSGRLVQEIEPDDLAQDGFGSVEEGFGTLVVHGRTGSALYVSASGDAPAPEAADGASPDEPAKKPNDR